MNVSVNTKSALILSLIATGAVSADAIASQGKMTVQQARGGLRSLRNLGLVGGDNEAVVMRAAGTKALAKIAKTEAPAAKTASTDAGAEVAHKRTTKIAKAVTLFDRHISRGRPAVLAKFQKDLDMTEGQASTYYQLVRKEKGLVGAAA